MGNIYIFFIWYSYDVTEGGIFICKCYSFVFGAYSGSLSMTGMQWLKRSVCRFWVRSDTLWSICMNQEDREIDWAKYKKSFVWLTCTQKYWYE